MIPTAHKRLTEALPIVIFCLIILQPLLDILSFWTDHLSMGNTLTLALRFIVLAGFGLFGFLLSQKKKAPERQPEEYITTCQYPNINAAKSNIIKSACFLM